MSKTYVTLGSTIRAFLSASKSVAPDAVTFKLVRASNRAEVAAAKGNWTSGTAGQTASRDDLSNSIQSMLPVDQAILDEVLGPEKMSEELRVDCVYSGTTYPGREVFVLWRNRIKVQTKKKEGSEQRPAPNAGLKCEIAYPPDYRRPAARLRAWVTNEDGEVDVELGGPGVVKFEWLSPYRFVKFLDAKQGKGPTVEALLTSFDPASFVWPRPLPPAQPGGAPPPCRQYVNLEAAPDGPDLGGRAQGSKLKLRVSKGAKGRNGDHLHVRAAISGPDAQTIDGKEVSVTFEGAELKVGASKVVDKALTAHEGFVEFDFDFKGQGGLTATLSVGVDGKQFDETVVVESWRKVELQPYHVVPGFYGADDKLAPPVADLVVKAFAEVFVETPILPSLDLFTTLGTPKTPQKFEVVAVPRDHALAIDELLKPMVGAAVMKPGAAAGPAAVVWLRNDANPSPNDHVKNNSASKDVLLGKHHTLRLVAFHKVYSDQVETVKLPVPQQSKARADELNASKTRLEAEIKAGQEPHITRIEELKANRKEIHTSKIVEVDGALERLARQRKARPDDAGIKAEIAELEATKKTGQSEKIEIDAELTRLNATVAELDAGPLAEKHAELKRVKEQLNNLEVRFDSARSAELKSSHYILPKAVDITGNNPAGILSLPGSFWETEDKAHRGDITTDDFLEVTGLQTYRVVIPDKPGSPFPHLARGAVNIKLKFRTLSTGAAGGSNPDSPVVWLTWSREDVGRAAFVIIHEVGHVLGQASSDTPAFFKLSGEHCAAGQASVKGAKADEEAYEVIKKGAFGSCVMWTPTGNKVTDRQHANSCHFCPNCARILRLTDLAHRVGTRAWK